ncbi:multifunctional CCA addition/repair protein [Arenicella xantha]|uniref:Multifunctional CCA protein n=1 Tax=Arenicella xantha TaxID=644221 RepID=A0A395JEQ0_9GAMM|nr:multifunctional CCA addition/repair protein [Arenicella xantha]RBP47083.1 tRNA nucleotidyltransferase (CCA-adding enzyme) [Arenicella xantha]
MDVYLVGGAIRDRLLGRQVLDRDWVVVGATPEIMVEKGYQPVGKDFPVFIDKRSGEEYALARTERKTAKGYQGFQFNASAEITLEQDLARRDLTVNAMAEDVDGNIIDPYHGRRDLEAGVLRHVSDAFVEDPVRILRTARFAARFKFTVAPETMSLMREMVQNGEVDALVPERVWAEMRKALDTDAPQLFFSVLRECGALARILPEIEALFGIPQTAKYHPEVDSGIHTLMVVEQAARLTPDPLVRFAALVHDLGKARTPSDELPSHRGHEQRGLPLIRDLCTRLRVPKKYQALALAVSEYHLHMHKMFELRAKTVLEMLEKTRSLMDDERANRVALCCLADARGRTGFEDREYPQAELFLKFQQAAKQVDAGSIAQGLSDGGLIQQRIHQARISAIKVVQKAIVREAD